MKRVGPRVPVALAALAAGFLATLPVCGQVSAPSDDVPLAVPAGSTVLSDLMFPVDGVVEDLEV
ncbi:MAG: hypothetical protein AAGF23_07770, partial [Acidobacteriota bacterium]